MNPTELMSVVASKLNEANASLKALARDLATMNAVMEACSDAETAFYAERAAIAQALKNAADELDREKQFTADPEFARLFRERAATLTAALRKENPEAFAPQEPVVIPAFAAPALGSDAEINRLIQERHRALAEARKGYFDGVRRHLGQNRRLAELVGAALAKNGRQTLWASIS